MPITNKIQNIKIEKFLNDFFKFFTLRDSESDSGTSVLIGRLDENLPSLYGSPQCIDESGIPNGLEREFSHATKTSEMRIGTLTR